MTGGIGSGKNEATKVFRELSVPIIDLDDISHQITQKNSLGYNELIKYFGNKYLDKDKNIIRKKLKIDVFNSTKIKKKLESILHPIILSRCKELVNEYKSEEYVVVVIPLLFETKSYLELIDESLLIDCEERIQFERISSRDNLDESLIKVIINSQLSRAQKIDKADKVIKNNLNKQLLKQEVCKYHNELRLRINGK
jgi:dephospho-CoA kinase